MSRATSTKRKLESYLKLNYPIELIEEEGRFVATIPDLPGCASFGDSADEAVEAVKETKKLWIEARLATGEAVPEPHSIGDYSDKFVLRISRSLHEALDHGARKEGTSLNQYVATLLAERNAIAELKRTLEPLFDLTKRYVESWSSLAPKWGSRPLDMEQRTLDEVTWQHLSFLPKPPEIFEYRSSKMKISHKQDSYDSGCGHEC
jgi:antitoxin HicB